MWLRPATPDDAAEVAGVHVRSWQVAYRGLIPDHVLDGMRPEDRAARYTFGSADPTVPFTTVALVAGKIVGFVTTVPAASSADQPGIGELSALYVDPPAWNTGAGRALIAAGRSRLAEFGVSEAVLWVLNGNERACRFYALDGWQPDGGRRTEVVWGAEVDELRYRRPL